MPVIQDRLTVTFYDEEEVELASQFRKILDKKNLSVNEILKELVKTYVKKET